MNTSETNSNNENKLIKFGKRHKLLLLLSGLIIILFAVILVSFLRIIKPELTKSFISEKDNITAVIATLVQNELSSESSEMDYETVLQDVMNRYDILVVYVHNQSMHRSRGGFVYKKISDNVDISLQAYNPSTSNNYFDEVLPVYSVSQRMFIKGSNSKPILNIVFSTKKLQNKITAIIHSLLILCTILAIVGIIISMMFLKTITKPISVLLSSISDIEAGNISERININPNDDLGRIALAFNGLLDIVEEYTFELTRISDDTENKIIERTQLLLEEVEDRKEIEKKLQQSNQMVRSIINASPYPIITVNNNFEVISASPAILSIFDYSENELIDTEIPIIYAPDRIKFKERIEKQDSSSAEKLVLKGRRKNGTLLDLSIASSAMFDEHKNRIGYLIIADDISERIKAENALKESEIKYRSLIEESIVGIGIVKDNHLTFANTALENIFEAEKYEELIDIPFDELVHHEDKYIIHSIFDRMAQNEVINKTEIRVNCFNGKEKYLEMAPNIVQFENENFLQITFLDVTERKEAIRQIEKINDELEERVIMRTTQLNKTLVELRNEMHQKTKLSSELQEKSATLDKTASFCFVFNSKGACLYITPYTERVFDVPVENLLGNAIWELEKFNIKYEIESGTFYNKENITEVLQDSVKIDSEPLVMKILSANNKVSYMQLKYSYGVNNTLILSGTDVTDQIISKQKLVVAAEQLSKSLEKEKELNDLKTRFVSMISHEYRTPLTVIMSSTGVVHQAIDNNKPAIAAKFLNKIESSVKTMTQLMEDVLVIGKAEANKREELVPIDIVSFVKNVIEDITMAYDYNCKINFEVKNDVGTFYSSEKMLHHIVQNLITNAMKYTINGEDAQIILSSDNNNITLSVQDHGIGIPEEDLKHLFSNFHRAKNVGSIAGTGLGLSIVKKNVESLQGTIDVQSQVNVGTTFTVVLPKDARS